MPRYAPGVIWEPFILALFLGLLVSAGLYFAYMWPAVEPDDDADEAVAEKEVAAAAKDADPAPRGVMGDEPAEEEPEVPPAEEAKLAAEAKAGAEAGS